jgi:hypothetical protein
MKNNILLAVLSSILAGSALLLSHRSPVPPESIIGYGAVLVLLGVAALEYRISWRRIFGRS